MTTGVNPAVFSSSWLGAVALISSLSIASNGCRVCIHVMSNTTTAGWTGTVHLHSP